MEQQGIICRDLFLRYTSPDGKSVIRQHRVWDGERFVKARMEEGANPKKPEDAYTVSPATVEDFRRQ